MPQPVLYLISTCVGTQNNYSPCIIRQNSQKALLRPLSHFLIPEARLMSAAFKVNITDQEFLFDAHNFSEQDASCLNHHGNQIHCCFDADKRLSPDYCCSFDKQNSDRGDEKIAVFVWVKALRLWHMLLLVVLLSTGLDG